MGKLISTLIVILLFVSCKTTKQPVMPTAVPIQYKEKIVERLVPVTNPADSLNLQALMECDEQNKVVLKELSEEKSRRIKSQFSLTNGQLKYNAIAVPDTLYVPVRDSSFYKEVPVYINVPLEVNKLTAWQKTQIKAGRVLFTLILAFGLYWLWKWKGIPIAIGMKTFFKTFLKFIK